VVPLSTMSHLASRSLPAVRGPISRFVGVACVGLLSLAACGGSGAESGKGSESGDVAGLVGNPAPDFSVKAVAGGSGTVSLKSLRGKVVLVDFWGTFCDPCKKSFPRLQDLHARYVGSGLRIVGISEDEADDKEKIPAFADSYGAKFTLGWDEDKAIAKSYKPDTMPSSFLIDRKGVVRYAHVGFHDGDEVEIEKEVKDLLGQ
jgi:cytochrome c biogenesis protein CcmG/thiol:disulfide interchange protein DsbE